MLVLLAVLLLAAIAADNAHAARPPGLNALTLRLTDLGPGYVVASEQDADCHDFSERVDLLGQPLGPPDGRICSMAFERIWTVAGTSPGPKSVVSDAIALPDETQAAALIADPQALARLTTIHDPLSDQQFSSIQPTPAIGDAAVMLRGKDGEVTVLWRQGAVLAHVEVRAPQRHPADAQAALRLAAAQAARIASPTPLLASENDDRDVPLDDPTLDVPVLWLGHELPGRQRRPPLRLFETVAEKGESGRGGGRLSLGYAGGGKLITIALRAPRALRRPAVRREQRRRARDGCNRVERLRLPHGRATIFWPLANCPSGYELSAIVERPRVSAIVLLQFCLDSCERAPRWATERGVRALLRALRVRPRPRPESDPTRRR